MARYDIKVKKSAEKELSKIPKKDLMKILDKIQALAEEPHPVGSIKLTNDEKYRIRVGNYRILYQIENHLLTIVVVKVGHRKEIYR